jgi:hypothetical protein
MKPTSGTIGLAAVACVAVPSLVRAEDRFQVADVEDALGP